MDDLISRQAAIDALLELVEARRTWISTEDARKEIRGIDASMCAIHDLPSAERRGRWIENETSYADPPTKQTCNCSVCGRKSTRPLGDWCRWCGAKMNGEEK